MYFVSQYEDIKAACIIMKHVQKNYKSDIVYKMSTFLNISFQQFTQMSKYAIY